MDKKIEYGYTDNSGATGIGELAATAPCIHCEEKPYNPLEHTVQDMLSSDYKARFVAEYMQTKIRYEKLKAFNNKIEAAEVTEYKGTLGVSMPKHDCPDTLLRNQQRFMGEYLHILEVRAVIEGIDLPLQVVR